MIYGSGRRLTRVAPLLAAVGALLVLVGPRPAAAQDADGRLDRLERRVEELRAELETRRDGDLEELRRRIEAITAELERLRLGPDVATADTSYFGFGPAASKIYEMPGGVSIGGYGEMLYENFASRREDGTEAATPDRIDALRAIVYAGYKFNDRFLFNSEIEFEHGSTELNGAVSVEFAYLDYLLSERAGLRAGLVLVPMGFLNELHEPTTWLGTERPLTERRIIPSTWRETGVGAFADMGSVSVRGFVVSGLRAEDGFVAAGLREGRQQGSEALAEDFAFTARVDYAPRPGLVFGASGYVGNAGQGAEDPLDPGTSLGARTSIYEGHVSYRAHGFDLRALYAGSRVDDAASVNAMNGLTGSASVGERLEGWYLQAGYDVLHRAPTDVGLVPYLRYESVDTQAEVPEGFAADPANDVQVWTIGAALRPIPQLILKTDYQVHRTAAASGIDQFNVALGYIF